MAAFLILRQHGGPAPGDDGLTFDDFADTNVFGMLRAVSRAIRNRTYRPWPTRLVECPREGRAPRRLRLQRLTDRTVAKALQLALGPWAATILPILKRDVWTLFAEMEFTVLHQRRYILATDDIRNCFPSLRIDDVLRVFAQHIPAETNSDEPALAWLIETVVRGHEGPDRTVGIDQGNPWSPLATEFTLHTLLDSVLEEHQPGIPLLYRYVDNINIPASNAHEADQILTEIRQLLALHDLELKTEDGPPVDLRDPDHGRKMLGLIPHWHGDYLDFRVPESTYGKLGECLEEAWNHRNPVRVCKEIVQGWIHALRPVLVNTEDADSIVTRLMEIFAAKGFRELHPDDLRQTVLCAHSQWMRERENVFSRMARASQGRNARERSPEG